MKSGKTIIYGSIMLAANAAIIAFVLLVLNPGGSKNGGEIIVDSALETARAAERARVSLALGNALHAFGFYEEAISMLASAAGDEKTRIAAKYFIGDSYLSMCMTEEALGPLAEAVNFLERRGTGSADNGGVSDPPDAEIYHSLAETNRMLEKYQAAAKYYKAAAESAPDSSFFLLELGNICLRNGDRAEAAEAYKRAVKEDRDWRGESKSVAYFNLATLSYRAGNIEESKSYLKKVLALEPANQAAREYLDALSAPPEKE
jgi:tetratricopeptide (TPR) repeat protein